MRNTRRATPGVALAAMLLIAIGTIECDWNSLAAPSTGRSSVALSTSNPAVAMVYSPPWEERCQPL